ncbi:MAG: Bcr/CflA family efflux MFS transporter [Oceanospirillales bacterium]|nr:MAG: Bcr/CflA family efflux MFS transporter [Oceanospirillales bacterium]
MNLPAKPIPGLIWMLAALTALAPLAVDAYLPAFPTMAQDFDVAVQQIELTLSVFLIGFALGQLTGGPFSDHFGRRTAIFTGLSLFLLGTLGIVFGQSIETLWGSRFLQALGGGISIVNSSAIVRDIYKGADSARAMSRISAIMMVAPMMAPFLGSAILQVGSWRIIFIVLVLYAITLLFTLKKHLPETRQSNGQPRLSPFKRYQQVITHRRALGYILAVAMGYGAMFAFITGSSSVYMGYFGASTALFPVLFGANVVMLLIFNKINARIVHRFTPKRLLAVAQYIQIFVGLSLISLITMTGLELWQMVVGIMLFIGLQGFIVSNGTASTLEFFPHSAATATALVGATGFALGGISGAIIGIFGDGSPLFLMITMTLAVICGVVLRKLLHHRQTLYLKTD